MEEEAKNQRNTGILKNRLIKSIAFLLIVGAAVAVTALAIKQRPEVLGLTTGSQVVQAEIDKLLDEVGGLIALPKDERPTVATVSDADKVREQPFFKNAQNGDKVIIYTNAKKAILYRPSEKQIVEVGAVNIQQPLSSPGVSPSPQGVTPLPSSSPNP